MYAPEHSAELATLLQAEAGTELAITANPNERPYARFLLLLGQERHSKQRLISWVLQMKRDTSLVYSTISTYLWGVDRISRLPAK